ncbi:MULTISPECIES: phosphoenolpyruvate--protein phosphotransferase [Bacillaceae]|uniref:Phosphoenolpyruvate-protein phosphotransferase n=1 Tax=Gottfriedia luciferensis TaxID=178774 RepID=A0ABX2ZJ70_9BACI|nr:MULTISPECIES: phosphoenolpyruvate--protein phosphotransferase [Bacillaceae]ODG89743.1 phosphoenolpyruvate--protein phosphotransferase [Gottfriedia luciferensis]PGZ91479.1 phosphoenolpyruvate--protein phosphotransferase [Bacillus sp. AFS029533]SFC72752.1 phosphotransferase system, enzyme I, PtsI [Bacillus sp. UNCCL81]
MSLHIKGIAASSGIAIAKAFRLENPELNIVKKQISDIDAEIAKLDNAIQVSNTELEKIRDHANAELGEDKAAIFSAHILVLNDPELVNPVKDKIKSESINADFAMNEVASMFVQMFESMDNEYMKERAADIRDVTKRVMAHLLGVTISNPANITEEVIIIAEDLTPSDTAQLNRKYALGFTTDIGGRTSHSAIMARSLEIPAVVGTKEVTSKIENGVMVIVDGLDGHVIVDPSNEELEEYKAKKEKFELQKVEWAKLKNEPTVTKDGHHVELVANIGTPNDVEGVINNGGEGVGLYRTEFLYMGRDNFPSEEEQFESYKSVLESMGDKPVVVRTLDIGGDKELSYLHLPKEMNPFLGYRAIRLCLDQKDIFRTQLRALLRASVYGNLKIMFPMIATLDEFRAAKAVLLEEKEQLVKENVQVSDNIEIGMMVEIPASAVLADVFAKEVDFFSIGTNDLIQYTMAADRMNEQVSYLYQPYNPSILRLVKMVIDAANKEGKWAGMCGEMAGDALAIPLLVGLGLHEFSMSATSILPARSQMAKLSKAEMEILAEKALSMSTAEEVVNLVNSI